MPNASRWGALLAASFPVAACSSAPVETTRVPASVRSATVASASVAPPAPSGFVPLLTSIPEATSDRESSGESEVFRIPYGHGIFTLHTVRAHHNPSHCAIVSDGGCAVFSLKTGAVTPDR